jgi:2-methylisocitrate lyase-like PEP mutase family enzyme
VWKRKGGQQKKKMGRGEEIVGRVQAAVDQKRRPPEAILARGLASVLRSADLLARYGLLSGDRGVVVVVGF